MENMYTSVKVPRVIILPFPIQIVIRYLQSKQVRSFLFRYNRHLHRQQNVLVVRAEREQSNKLC